MFEKFLTLFRRQTGRIDKYFPEAGSAVRVAQQIQNNVMSAATLGALTNDEAADAFAVVDRLRRNTVVILNWPYEIDSALGKLWNEGISPDQFLLQKAEVLRNASDTGIRFSRGRPDWRFALSEKFIKSIQNADEKLQGRILEAITKIAEAPTIPVGDTVKPLAADLKGLWRYTIQTLTKNTLRCFGSITEVPHTHKPNRSLGKGVRSAYAPPSRCRCPPVSDNRNLPHHLRYLG